jgi:hypothetical protein
MLSATSHEPLPPWLLVAGASQARPLDKSSVSQKKQEHNDLRGDAFHEISFL